MSPEARPGSRLSRAAGFWGGLSLGVAGMFLSLAVGICVRGAGYLLDLAPVAVSGLAALAMAVAWRRGSVVVGFLISLVLVSGMIGVVLQQMFKNWRF